jgi:hypothetical protein
MFSITKPNQHKLEYFTFFNDKDLYFKLIRTWLKKSRKYGTQEIISDKGKRSYKINEPIIIEEDSFDFRSKYGLTYRKEGDEYKRNFEYEIKIRSRDNMKSYYLCFKPEISDFYYGKHATKGDHNPYKPKKNKEGVEVNYVSVNVTYDEGQELFKKLMEKLGLGKYWTNQKKDMGKIKQCEFYLRYNHDKEGYVGETLHNVDRVIGLSDFCQKKTTLDKEEGKYLLYSIRSNSFDELGFENHKKEWKFAIKTYRAREWQKFNENEPLHNPKLEIYLDDEKKGRKYPDLNDFEELKNEMRQIAGNICLWSKINNEDFIEDSYFSPSNAERFEVIEKTEYLEKLNKLYERIKPEIRKEILELASKRDYLKCLCIYENVTYKTLMKFTKLSEIWIKKITYNLEEKGIIQTYRGSNIAHNTSYKDKKTGKVRNFGSPTYIVFKNKFICESTKSIVSVLDHDIDGNEFEEEREKRKEDRKERREKRKYWRKTFSKELIHKKVIKHLVEKEYLEKCNGGLYELTNFTFEGEIPEKYESLMEEYG